MLGKAAVLLACLLLLTNGLVSEGLLRGRSIASGNGPRALAAADGPLGCGARANLVPANPQPCIIEQLQRAQPSGYLDSPGNTCDPYDERITITECQLAGAMGGRCPNGNCAYYLVHILRALQEFDLNCPRRTAAFLAFVRHLTSGLETLSQDLEDCRGGALRLPAAEYYRFLNTTTNDLLLEPLKREFSTQFGGLWAFNSSQSCSPPSSNWCAVRYIQERENAFATAGWWLKRGPCQDLRLVADAGRGVPRGPGGQPPQGIYSMAECLLNTQNISLQNKLVEYYDQALEAVGGDTVGLTPGAIAAIVIGAFVMVLIIVAAGCCVWRYWYRFSRKTGYHRSQAVFSSGTSPAHSGGLYNGGPPHLGREGPSIDFISALKNGTYPSMEFSPHNSGVLPSPGGTIFNSGPQVPRSGRVDEIYTARPVQGYPSGDFPRGVPVIPPHSGHPHSGNFSVTTSPRFCGDPPPAAVLIKYDERDLNANQPLPELGPDTFRGVLNSDAVVMVRQLPPVLGIGAKEPEVKARIKELSRIAHPHIQALKGYCVTRNGKYRLIYDHTATDEAPTLATCLREPPTECGLLSWPQRMRIADQLANAIAYLHECINPPIVLGKLESTTVLLVERPGESPPLWPVLAGAGMQSFMELASTSQAAVGRATTQGDVLLFGLVLFELISGRAVTSADLRGPSNLLEKALELMAGGMAPGGLVDARLGGNFVGGEVSALVAVAATCVQEDPVRRPSMAQVVGNLEAARQPGMKRLLSRRMAAQLQPSGPTFRPALSMQRAHPPPSPSPPVVPEGAQLIAPPALWDSDDWEVPEGALGGGGNDRDPPGGVDGEEPPYSTGLSGSSEVAGGYESWVQGSEILLEQVELRGFIGNGGFGSLYLGVWIGTDIAVKRVVSTGIGKQAVWREVAILRRLRHPNVVLFMGAVVNPPDEVWILTEYVPRGSLYDVIHKPGPDSEDLGVGRLLKMALDIAKGMSYLHAQGIVHRDLKTQNLLVANDGTIKVCDFGQSRVCRRRRVDTSTTAGTFPYTAPEAFSNPESNEKCDVYSFAIVLWELMVQKIPWEGYMLPQVMNAVINGLRPELPADIDEGTAALIQKCWQDNPDERPSFEQVTLELNKLVKAFVDEPTTAVFASSLTRPVLSPTIAGQSAFRNGGRPRG